LLKREPDRIAHELEKRVRTDVQKKGDFSRVHPLPASGQDVPDDPDARLVVLGIDHPYGKELNSPAEDAARGILEFRGSSPRLYRNALVFLAVDKLRYQELEDAVRRYLAWASILDDKEALDLSPHQVKQAQTQKNSADSTVTVRLPESYQWLLVPEQASPQGSMQWQALRLNGQESLAVRASRKLRSGERLLTGLAGTALRMELDRIPLWREDHVSVKQLVEHFASYPYLSRLRDPEVLLGAVRDGVSLLSWERDTFAYADSYDEEASRYRGLRGGRQLVLTSPEGLLVKPDVARRQLEAESAKPTVGVPPTSGEREPAFG
jgi:hypothetical protein